jgi:hypothetical protein
MRRRISFGVIGKGFVAEGCCMVVVEVKVGCGVGVGIRNEHACDVDPIRPCLGVHVI